MGNWSTVLIQYTWYQEWRWWYKMTKTTIKDIDKNNCKEVLSFTPTSFETKFFWSSTKRNQNPKAQFIFQHFGGTLKAALQWKLAKLTQNQRNFQSRIPKTRHNCLFARFLTKMFKIIIMITWLLMYNKIPIKMELVNWVYWDNLQEFAASWQSHKEHW